jgi:hypothetical protein
MVRNDVDAGFVDRNDGAFVELPVDQLTDPFERPRAIPDACE